MERDPIFPDGDAKFEAMYAEEAAMVDASELIAAALAETGMTKTELATKLGISKSEVSARLAGERNITVRKLAATLHALDHRLVLASSDIRDSERQAYERWTSIRQPRTSSGAARSDHLAAWRKAN